MICKYCGGQLSRNICPLCYKEASLSYTSHELADILGIGIGFNPDLNEMQRKSAYDNGFAEGQKCGFEKGYNSAKTETYKAIKRQRRFFIIAAAGGAVALALLCSILVGKMRYNSGYNNGVFDCRQEQYVVDESAFEEYFQQGYEAGNIAGYSAGHQVGYDQGLLATHIPVMIPAPTSEQTSQPKPTPTPKPPMLGMKSKGDYVSQLQKRLITLGYLAENEADGNFGSKTENAVKQFQTTNGVEITGVVDQELWELIMSDTAITATADNQSTTVTPTVQLTVTAAPEADATDGSIGSVKSDLPDENYDMALE